MEAEIAVYEKAIQEVGSWLSRDDATKVEQAKKVLLKAQQDIDRIRQMRSIAQEEIKKQFGDT